MARPMLGGVELQQVQAIEVEGDQVLVQHGVPALEGDFLQRLGRRGTRVTLTGVLTGPEAGGGLKSLRDKFRDAEPVSFVADITTATQVDQVLIEEMGVRELAGKPERFEYAFTLREYTPLPPPEEEPPPDIETPENPAERIDQRVGALRVKVTVEGQTGFDFSTVTVTVDGEEEDGTRLSRTLTNRTAENIWEEQEFPTGEYTVTAIATDPQPMSDSAPATVRAGQEEQVTIVLRPGQIIATAFLIHFHFDKSFIEPCMRAVMRQVAEYAQAHPDEKLVIVGHTDLVGPGEYNQSLSERRARSAYAYLTFGRDKNARDAALAEWDQLRRRRPRRVRRSIHDTWGAREYQHILQDLGYYSGNVNGKQDDMTDEAVRTFQQDKGLTVDGIVGDETWPALIEAYLDKEPLSVPESQFLPNCEGEILKWLGCEEQDPIKDTQDAWRPNRRTEFLFVMASELPCDCKVPEPDTFNLPDPGAVNDSWCLGPGDPNVRCCCFSTRITKEQSGDPNVEAKCKWEACKWLIRPAEPGTIKVQGSITFEDGTPLANAEYILIAPDGEFMDGEVPRTRRDGVRAGTGIPGKTKADGTFEYSKQKRVGVYTLEIKGPYVARLKGEPIEGAKGNVVCKRLRSDDPELNVVVVDQAVVMVKPSITPPTSIVVVKKPYTNPARQPVTLRTESPFTGTGTLNRSNDSVHFFTSAVGGTEITFDGTDNVFTAAQLTVGHTIYTEGVRPSAALDDVQLTLTLTVNGQRGLSATAKRTSVELTLDICMSRTAAGVDPPLISSNDKINIGRFVQVRDPAHNHERAMLIVRQAQPAVFAEDLVLTPINAKVQLFADEVPATGQIPLITPHNIPDSATLANGARFFVQGIGVSTAVRDTGFQLGIRDVENDGDRVAITVVQIEITENSTANAPAVTFTRFGLWDNAYDAAGNVRNGVAEAANFVGADTRKYHFRLRDPAGAGEVQVNWKTLNADRTTDDDAPVSQALTLLETAPGSKVFVSRAVTLVTDNTDRDFPTNSGLNLPHPDAGLRQSGQSNHRTRRAKIDGFVRGEYSPQAGVRLPVILPVFDRDPDERKRLNVQVIRYTDASFVAATDGYIAQQFRHANDRWNQVGIQIDSQATIDRQIPAGALTGSEYAGSLDNANEQAALNDLIPITPDNTVTAVFVPLSGANAYATTFQRTTVVLGDRYFIFIDEDLDLTDETLAHELHHVLFNRGDTATDDQFFTFNTTPPGDLVAGTGIVLPHVRIYRRVQNMNSPDPNNDPNNDNVINWARRQRTARFPIAPGISPATATTGNRLVQNF